MKGLRRSVGMEARRVTVTDYEEDGFDAGGDADLVSGGITKGTSFVEVIARDAPRAAPDGNAFEIFASARPAAERAHNSYRRVRLVDVSADAPVAFWGPLQALEITGVRAGTIEQVHGQ